MIELSKIRIDGGTQARAEVNQETVAEYAEAYRAGISMPPVIVFYDGSTHWLADGFHRYFGAKQAGKETIHEEVTPGSLRDAVLFSLGANAKHGLRRSNADKRKAVKTLLADPEWVAWSDNEIAKRCLVSNHLVADTKRELTWNSPSEQPAERTVTTKHGTTTTMNTANIGKTPIVPIQPTPVAASAKKTAEPATIDSKCEEFDGVDSPSELEELREFSDTQGQTIKELLAENASMTRVLDADDQIATALAEAKQYRELNRVLTERITGLTNEKNEAIRLLKIAQRRAERAEAALSKEAAECKPT